VATFNFVLVVSHTTIKEVVDCLSVAFSLEKLAKSVIHQPIANCTMCSFPFSSIENERKIPFHKCIIDTNISFLKQCLLFYVAFRNKKKSCTAPFQGQCYFFSNTLNCSNMIAR
jgi:hypothetical protein